MLLSYRCVSDLEFWRSLGRPTVVETQALRNWEEVAALSTDARIALRTLADVGLAGSPRKVHYRYDEPVVW